MGIGTLGGMLGFWILASIGIEVPFRLTTYGFGIGFGLFGVIMGVRMSITIWRYQSYLNREMTEMRNGLMD